MEYPLRAGDRAGRAGVLRPMVTVNPDRAPSRRLTWAGVWLGLALGGFFDGIVFHQILQWHHMLTSVADPAVRGDLPLNTLADGLFHAACWIFLVVGLVVLWLARGEFGVLAWARTFVGGILMGAGAFNLIEGIVNHHLLGIHHVRTGSPNELLWDLGFLASGAALAGLGWSLRPRVSSRGTGA